MSVTERILTEGAVELLARALSDREMGYWSNLDYLRDRFRREARALIQRAGLVAIAPEQIEAAKAHPQCSWDFDRSNHPAPDCPRCHAFDALGVHALASWDELRGGV